MQIPVPVTQFSFSSAKTTNPSSHFTPSGTSMNAMKADQIELLSGKKTSQPKITVQANGVTFSFVGDAFHCCKYKKRECY